MQQTIFERQARKFFVVLPSTYSSTKSTNDETRFLKKIIRSLEGVSSSIIWQKTHYDNAGGNSRNHYNSHRSRFGNTWLPYQDLAMIIPWPGRNMVMIMPWWRHGGHNSWHCRYDSWHDHGMITNFPWFIPWLCAMVIVLWLYIQKWRHLLQLHFLLLVGIYREISNQGLEKKFSHCDSRAFYFKKRRWKKLQKGYLDNLWRMS